MNDNSVTPEQTTSLLHTARPIFYPAHIPQQHQQLKNYIGTQDRDIIYYASQREVYAIHTKTHKRELIRSLQWAPRCLCAGHGWICAGSEENGKCAFIRLNARGSARNAACPSAEVDDLLPLDLNPEPRAPTLHEQPQDRAPDPFLSRYDLYNYELGGSIVNSVTIHMDTTESDPSKHEILAVLTNNDLTVRIFSLSRLCLVSTIQYPTPMNHASISPGGDLLLAVGDEPQVFFHRRICRTACIDSPAKATNHHWRLLADPMLTLAHKKDPEDCCFSTAFSDTGRLCAVATQRGLAMVFDTASIKEDMVDDDAVIGILKSTRPRENGGAIRSMRFSPPPWDLLAWAEEQGRVSVVDLRNEIGKIQILKLDSQSRYLQRISMTDQEDIHQERQLGAERRRIDAHRVNLEALAAANDAEDFMDAATDRRRRDHESFRGDLQVLRSNPDRLTDDERQMIDSIGIRRVQAHGDQIAHPASASARIESESPALTRTSRHLQVQPWLPTSTIPGRSNASIAEYMRQRNFLRANNLHQPRRRNSIVVSSGDTMSSPISVSLESTDTHTETLSTSPSRLITNPTTSLPATRSQDRAVDEPAWHTITEAMRTSNETLARMRRLDASELRSPQSQPAYHHQMHLLEQLSVRNERQRIANAENERRLRQMQAAIGRGELGYEEENSHLLEERAGSDRNIIMGLDWSPDGRYLYIATEEGIFEYRVNIDERKQFPDLCFL